MKNKIDVSVIVPVYNTSLYLDKCLKSLCNQTLKNIEIIVVDDGSKEDINSIVSKYKNIIYIKNKHMGIGYTRNTGIKNAIGEYIGFVDSDDFVDEKMYEDYYRYAKDNNLDIVVGNIIKQSGSKKETLFVSFFKVSNIKKNPEILTKIDYGPCNKIFKRELLIKKKILFDENLKYEDMPFVFKAVYYSKKIGNINKSYYHYVVRSKSETTTFDDKNFDIIKVLDIFSKMYKKDYFLETEFVIVSKLLDYNIQQRSNKDKITRDEFINETFNYIYNEFPNFKQNKYLNSEKYYKRVIKQSRWLVKVYCFWYQKLKLYDKIK